MTTPTERPPSIDALARELSAHFDLPHGMLVMCARRAVSLDPINSVELAHDMARDIHRSMLTEVINATGVLLHTNLGRAPLPFTMSGRPTNLEFDLVTGERGSRQQSTSTLISQLTGAEAAIVVNNNAAAVLLVLAALAEGHDVAVSRGESVEIGGGFRIPDVMEQSGARLIDVGTTNRTRLRDYQRAIDSRRNGVALVMKIHPSNFSIDGFTESTSIAELATLGVPVVADIGSGLIDNSCPWLHGHIDKIPGWLLNEPAAKQALADGADLVTFSGDKLMGGPQCGIIAGRADLVDACASHPLMRALRPGGHTLVALQQVLTAYVSRTACAVLPFWSMVATGLDELRRRADDIVGSTAFGEIADLDSLVGAGSAPGTTIPSVGVALAGDHRAALRDHPTPIVARALEGRTFIDLRSVRPDDDALIIEALRSLRGS